MSAWKAGKVHWFNPEEEEGMIIDKETGAVFFLNQLGSKELNSFKGRKKGKQIEYKTKEDFRGISVNKVREA